MGISPLSLCAAALILLAQAHPAASLATLPPPSTKYFHEPGGSAARTHYDERFFRGELPYNDRPPVLRALARSYLSMMRGHGAETWLAHGTLLGWWWNAQVMPWDHDLDAQVLPSTMQFLAEALNGTEYVVLDKGVDGGVHNRTYLLDVNPHYTDADAGDGENIIDGRWIDVDNGMFVDITVVAQRGGRNGAWSCKNGHRYAARQLWPLRVSEFEGVTALVPFDFEGILASEYSRRSLSDEAFQ